ncbi:MAG: MFS transporter [Spirochaetales bacterium]|nr:MFS transporter [Spirochaetales bacterium]MCF7938963.1 MFS transporter [Spirochaetales bacterium]
MKLTRRERSWAFYDWANSAYTIMVTTAVFPLFYKEYLAVDLPGYQSTAQLGYANSLATLVLAVLAPVIGSFADVRGAKRKFFLVFLLLGAGAAAMLGLSGRGDWQPALWIYILSAIGFAGANLVYDSFLTDVTTPERMDRVSARGYALGYIGGSTIPLVLALMLILNAERLGFAGPFQATALTFPMIALWWIGFTLPMLRNVQQVYGIERKPRIVLDAFRRLGKTAKDIFVDRRRLLFLAAYFFYIDGVGTIIKMATAYGSDAGLTSESMLVVLLAIQVIAFPFALLYGKLAARFTPERMIFVGILVYFGVTALAFFLPAAEEGKKLLMFWFMAILVATSQGGIQALSRSVYGKLIPPQRSAEFYGFYNVFGKFAAMLGPLLMGLVSSMAKSSRFGVLGIAVLFLIGGFLLIRFRQVVKGYNGRTDSPV